MYFDAGTDVYELIDPQGLAYVMQAYCTGVDATLDEQSLADLGRAPRATNRLEISNPCSPRGVDRGHLAFGGNGAPR